MEGINDVINRTKRVATVLTQVSDEFICSIAESEGESPEEPLSCCIGMNGLAAAFELTWKATTATVPMLK